MDRFQAILDRINEKFGAAGSVLSVVFWLVVLFFTFKGMLFPG